jgi:hypothetical protein
LFAMPPISRRLLPKWEIIAGCMVNGRLIRDGLQDRVNHPLTMFLELAGLML